MAALALLTVFGAYVFYEKWQELSVRRRIIESSTKSAADLNELLSNPDFTDHEFIIHLLRVISGKAKISSLPF